MAKKVVYWFTIGWGADEDYELSLPRYTYKDTLESVKYYLKKYKKRGAYFICASRGEEDITDQIEQELK